MWPFGVWGDAVRPAGVALQWDSDHIYLIMEFCAGGDLSRFIRMRRILPEKVARIFLQQLGENHVGLRDEDHWDSWCECQHPTSLLIFLACALKFLHDHNISHLDLKPQNILLSTPENPQLKLAGQVPALGCCGAVVGCS